MTRSLILADSLIDGWGWSSEWDSQAGAVWAVPREAGTVIARERWFALPVFGPARDRPDVARHLAQMVADYTGWHWQHRDPQECSRQGLRVWSQEG
jgi:hypothetical protein